MKYISLCSLSLLLFAHQAKSVAPLAIAIPPAGAIVQGTVAGLCVPAVTLAGILGCPAWILASPIILGAYLASQETKKVEDNKTKEFTKVQQ